MRIIGGRDYYDSGLASGHDTHTTFVRGSESLSEAEAARLGLFPSEMRATLVEAGAPARSGREIFPGHREIPIASGDARFGFPTVIACGRRYQGVRIAQSPGGSHYFWSREKLEEWLGGHRLEMQVSHWHPETLSYFEPADLPRDLLAQVLERRWTLLVHDPVPEGFRSGPSPWLIDQPVLRAVEFFRVIPANLMYQEIDMWLGSRLPGADRPTVEISEADRMAKHGMDRTSFRRPPSR